MREQLLQLQVFYEIATAIGNHLDLRRMLRESLSAYLRKLNCSAGGVFRMNRSEPSPGFQPVFSIPRHLNRNPGWTAAMAEIPDRLNAGLASRFLANLPRSGAADSDHFFHLFPLPDFGLLVLIKRRRPLDEAVLQSLTPLNLKLARSCTACGQNREIERMNRRLTHEVAERRRAEAALRSLTDELENRVADRTRELERANRRLREEVQERRQAQTALVQSQARYREIFENIQDVFYATSLDGIITEVSPSIEGISGYTRADVLGMPVERIYKDMAVRETLLDELMDAGRVSDYEIELLDRDGSVHHCMVNAALVRDSDGAPTGAVGSLRDITEQRRAERERNRLEERLARSHKMEALGLLAGGVAHDLNNVLSGIVGYPDLLLANLPADSEFRKPIEQILQSGKKAAAIVEDLLTLARRGVTRRDPVDLNALVTDYLSSPEFRKLQEYHPNLRVETRLEAAPATVLGSDVHLKKTVMNLVSNAAEAGGKRVRIQTGFQRVDGSIPAYDGHREGHFVRLQITDDGMGISATDLARIFEPFYTKKVMGRSGTGLGMAVVWGTVKDHGGFLNVESTEGKGTRFQLFFPVSEIPAVPPPAGSAIPRGKGERVLVVDDVAEQRDIAQSMLQWLGYAADAVSGGEAAVARLETESYDLLMLDMIMAPGIDGLETLRRVRRFRPDQRVLMASGYADSCRVYQALKSGARGPLRKPYTLEQLGKAIQEALETAAAGPRLPVTDRSG